VSKKFIIQDQREQPFWDDLQPLARYLFTEILQSHRFKPLLGILRFNPASGMPETGMSAMDFRANLGHLHRNSQGWVRADWYGGIIWLPYYLDFDDPPKGEKRVIGMLNQLRGLWNGTGKHELIWEAACYLSALPSTAAARNSQQIEPEKWAWLDKITGCQRDDMTLCVPWPDVEKVPAPRPVRAPAAKAATVKAKPTEKPGNGEPMTEKQIGIRGGIEGKKAIEAERKNPGAGDLYLGDLEPGPILDRARVKLEDWLERNRG